MAYLYDLEMNNDVFNWCYVITDFNNDEILDLYIKLSDTYDSALFTYKDEQVKWIYIDSLETNCYRFPMDDGSFVEIYDYWIAPTTTVFEFDDEFNCIITSQYIKSDQKETIENLNDEYGVLEGVTNYTQNYRYYFKSAEEKRAMNETEWNEFQDWLNKERLTLISLDDLD